MTISIPHCSLWIALVVPAVALAGAAACSSSSSAGGGAPDGAAMDGAPADQTTPESGTMEASSGDGAPQDGDAGDGAAPTGDGGCPGAAVACNGQTCAPGCACIEEGHNQRVACFCPTNDGGPAACVSPNCGGSILCVSPMQCDAGPFGCALPEGADASARDGGPLCTNAAGAFEGSAGSCNGNSCAPGCACVPGAGGGGDCFCAPPLNPDAGSICVAPTCGNIFCAMGCTCSDGTAGTCACP